ncbi:MAG: glycosyltransferase family 39 protein [Chloroflexi bacterium]|nr:glycosyltransferase family 39 protein [Chloroflexota bacterium]
MSRPAGSGRPWAGLPEGRVVWLLLAAIVLLALGLRVAFSFRAPPFVTNDSLSYLLPGFDLVHGGTFAPILKRPPLYSLFIGGVIAAFGEELRVLMLVQHLMGVGTVLLTFGIGRLLFGASAGLLAALLTALSGPLIVTEHYLMSETLFGLLLAGSLLTYLGALRVERLTTRLWLLALAGVLLSLAALTRPIAQVVLALLLAALPLLLPRWRPALLGAGLLAAVFVLVALPWMLRNQAVQGTFAIAGGSGEGLAVRTIRYEQKFDFKAPPGGDPDRLTSRARSIYRDEAEDGSAFELAKRLRVELGITEIEAERFMRTFALQAILKQPGYYLLGTADMFVQTFVGRPVRLRQDWLPWRNIAWEERVQHLLPEPTPVEARSFTTAERLATLYDPAPFAPALALLSLLGIVLAARQRRWDAVMVGVLVYGLLLAGAALIGIEWRYRFPLDPLINVLAAGGLTSLVGALATRVHRPTTPTSPAVAQASGSGT